MGGLLSTDGTNHAGGVALSSLHLAKAWESSRYTSLITHYSVDRFVKHRKVLEVSY